MEVGAQFSNTHFTTRVPDTCDTGVTRVQHECDRNTTLVYTNEMSATRVEDFDFDNGTSENIFPHPCISYMANKTIQGEEEFHSKNYLLEMPCYHAKMHLKSAPQKLIFMMAKSYIRKLSPRL